MSGTTSSGPSGSSGKTLVLVARTGLTEAALSRIEALGRSGASVVAWQHPPIAQERFPSPDVVVALGSRGIEATSLSRALGDDGDAAVEDAVIDWMKALGRARLSTEGSFRTLFRHAGISLWWWAELFLYHETPLRLHVRDVEALARLCEREKPERIVLFGPVRDLEAAARRFAPLVEVVANGGAPPPPWRSSHLITTVRFLAALVKMWGTALKGFLRRRPPQAGRSRFVFLTHASMWKERALSPTRRGWGPDAIGGLRPDTGRPELYELYFDPIIPTLEARGERVRAVAVGPPVPFKKRRLGTILSEILELDKNLRPYVSMREYFPSERLLSLSQAFWNCRRDWKRFRELDGVPRALSHRGVALGRPALESFRDTFFLQLPWAIRSYHEVLSCLEEERPSVLVLYAESSGLGRAAVAAARATGVPTFALQHGIMYPRYYSHEHAPDEVDECPLPTRTAVFGSLARDLLVNRSHYRPETIVVTGSPKFDALVEAARRYDRAGIRARLGVGEKDPLLVVATRFSAIGPVFRELVRASSRVTGLVLLVKPHQAERPDPYVSAAAEEGAKNVLVLTGQENLVELLFASDGLVTVDSLASSEALVLGRPVLVVNLPSNLTPLVERGVALGARGEDEMARQIGRLLYDEALLRELGDRRKAYIQEFAFGADGGSTARIVRAIEETGGLKP